MIHRKSVFATTVAALLASTPLFAADHGSDGDGERSDEAQIMQAAKLSAADAGAAATKAVPGKIYEVGFDATKSGSVWNVTVAGQDGSETLVVVDADSGKIVSQSAEGERADDHDGEDGD